MYSTFKVRDLLVRGMLAGVAAGVFALGFAVLFGEPEIDNAIAVEEANAEASPHTHGDEEEGSAVSRETQKTIGLATGMAVYGVAVGGVFALAFAVVQGRIGPFRPRTTSALLAAAAFLTVVLVPYLKYPATPPAVGDPETIERRAALYVAMIAISIVAAIASTQLGRSLAARVGAWNAALISGAAFLLVVGGTQLLLPSVNEVAAGFPADVLWRFRLASLGTHLALWTALGIGFGVLAERVLSSAPTMSAAPAPPPA